MVPMMMRTIKMSDDKLERILATYPPVDGKPGYVWFSKANLQIVKLEVLREAMQEYFEKGSVGDE